MVTVKGLSKPIDERNVRKLGKYAGDCPGCELMVGEKDIKSGKFKCGRCGKVSTAAQVKKGRRFARTGAEDIRN